MIHFNSAESEAEPQEKNSKEAYCHSFIPTFATLTYAARILYVFTVSGFTYDSLSSRCYYPHLEDEETEAPRPPQGKLVQLRLTSRAS